MGLTTRESRRGSPPGSKRRSAGRYLQPYRWLAPAANPKDRYPTVEALRRDIERFQEGRSVSAKEDTYREAAWKLVKRNKALSAATAVVAVVLVWSSVANFLARRDAEKANAETTQRTARAVPALVRSARLLVNEWQMEEALAQLEFAQKYDAKYAEARLVKRASVHRPKELRSRTSRVGTIPAGATTG